MTLEGVEGDPEQNDGAWKKLFRYRLWRIRNEFKEFTENSIILLRN